MIHQETHPEKVEDAARKRHARKRDIRKEEDVGLIVLRKNLTQILESLQKLNLHKNKKCP